jgi:ribosomal protein L22
MPVPRRSRKGKKDAEKEDVAPEETPEAEVEEAEAPTEGTSEPDAAATAGDDEAGDEATADDRDDPAIEDEPTPKAKSKTKAAPKPKAAAEAEDDEDDGDAESEADAKAKAKEASRPKRRRGAAETTTRREPARPVPRRESDGAIQVRAKARYVRSAPRKARLVMDHIRGKRVEDARAILRHTPRAAATDISKLLESAVANAENNFELDPDDLKVDRAFVDEGPTIKRFRPRALGRATPIHKRTSHMTITLTTDQKGK